MISVCIAAYNGQDYIIDQINSILIQLNLDDELIIVDDYSTDRTYSILENVNDFRIKLFRNSTNMGVNFTFNRAISLSTGDYIFLSDQDDIWTNGHISKSIQILECAKISLVTSNFSLVDKSGYYLDDMKYPLIQGDSNKYIKNIVKIFLGNIDYYGCCMGFSRDFKAIILPFPFFIESHDIWMAMCSNLIRSNYHLEDILLHHKIHGLNASVVNRNVFKKIKSRILFFISILVIYKRYFKLKIK